MRVLNLGAGIQSTTIYLMMLRGEVQPAEIAFFADTQEEPAEVYTHLLWLQSLGGAPIKTVTVGKLGDDLLKGRNSTGGRFVSIPAYTKAYGSKEEGRLKRQCTKEYKIEPILKSFRYDVLKLKYRARMRGHHSFIFGISLDEQALEIDEGLRGGAVINRKINQPMFLHRSCKPLSEADLEERQQSLGFTVECLGMCGQ